MTTPAINRNVNSYTSSGNNITLPSGASSPFPCVYQWDQETRPASATRPIDPITGWRSCGLWNHSGRLFNFNKGTNRRCTYDVATGKLLAGVEWRNGSFFASYSPPAISAIPSGLQSEAEIKALNRLKDQTIHLGNFIAESRQTLDLIRNAAFSIASQVFAFRRQNPKLWVQVRKWQTGGLPKADWRCIPNKWLELQYGWKPLMSDLYGALQELNRSRRKELLFSVKGTSYRFNSYDRTVNAMAGSSVAKFRSYQKHECRVKLWYKLNSHALAELSSLGLINPAEIAWEILKYSFVIDWFLPVGNWLSALTADVGYDFKSGSCTFRSKADDRWQSTSFEDFLQSPTVRLRASGDDPGVSGLAYRFSRSCYSSSPVPGVYLKNPLSAVHAANAIALLSQAFRR